MPKFLAAIDLSKNELRNARIQNLATAPSSPVAGQLYFDTSASKLYVYDGSSWVAGGASGAAGGDLTGTYPNPTIAASAVDNSKISATANIALSKLATNPLARANHTGTQTASTISDFDTQVRTSRLDQFAAPTANVSLNSNKLTNLTDPTSAQDAATKAYVDAGSQGLDVKNSVRAATTANITLSGTQTIDGVSLSAGDRVLVKNQTTASANGIYVVAAGAWSRSTDADSSTKVNPGMYTFVEEGTSNADSGFILTTDGTITLGTTSLAFAQFSGAGQITAGAGLTKTGNSIDVVGTSNRISVAADSIDIDAAYVGQTSITTLGTIATGTWSATTIALNKGGTGATTAAAARTNLGAVGKYVTTNGGTTSDTVTHNLGTSDVTVSIREVSSGAIVYADAVVTDSNTVTVTWATAPSASAYSIVVIG